MTEQPAILDLINPELEEPVDTTEQDLTLVQERLKRLKESHKKTQGIVKEMMVQLDELESLEKRTLEVLLNKLEKQ